MPVINIIDENKMKLKKNMIVILFLIFGLTKNLEADIIYAASCSQEDVQAAIDLANDGDIVIVPAGTCTWDSAVSFYKSITVQGAGIDSTIIIDSTPGYPTWEQTPFWISGSTGKTFRITGFTFKDTRTSDPNGIIKIIGHNNTFRIDHVKFDDILNRGIWIKGRSYGVIDHNIFVKETDDNFVAIHIEDDVIMVDETEDSWSRPMSYGTAEAVYIEDNTFDYDYHNFGTDCQMGGRYVFRYNIVNGTTVGNHGYNSVASSCLQEEIYNNIFNPPEGVSVYRAIQFRGGTGVIFNNTITGDYTHAIHVTNYRSCSDGFYPGKGPCDGTSPEDGNTPPDSVNHGWPCYDQIGRGTNQESYPLYEWDNAINGQDADIEVYDAGSETCYTTIHIQEGRDYYNDTPMPGYTPYTYPHPLVTGIEESEKLKTVLPLAFNVVPNPFTFYAAAPGYEKSQFAVYDVAGKRVGIYRGNRIGEELPAGVYFVMDKAKNAMPMLIVKVR